MRTVAVLGSTGSIGTQALEVLRAEPALGEVVALAASSSVEDLAVQARAWRPKLVAVADPARRAELVDAVPPGTEVLAGPDALAELATCADVVLISAVVGLGSIDSFGDGALVGLAVAVAAPLGDLCQSLVKRDLGVKDMGTALPGHGGFLDRFDSLLFVLPTAYYIATRYFPG